MDALALVVVAFAGTFLWVLNPEAATALFASRRGWPPLVVGLLAASGQGAALGVLFVSGDQLRRRWGRFDRWCERMRTRHGARMTQGAVPLACGSGLLGLPPSSVLAALGPGLGLRTTRLLPILFVARVVRLSVVALLAERAGAAFLKH